MQTRNLTLASLLLISGTLLGCGGTSGESGTDTNELDPIVRDLNVSTDTCVSIISNITVDTIWNAGCYKVEIDLDVDATLSIAEGTKVYFEAGRSMRIDDGSLVAKGTEAKPILFSSDEKIQGYWDGINFYGSPSNENEIAHAVIEYAKIGLELSGVSTTGSELKMSDSILRKNSEYGFKFNASANLGTFLNIRSYDNAVAGYTYASSLHNLDASSDFKGNVKDYIEVYGNIVDSEQTWNALSVPALFTHSVEIDAFLKIKEGASFLCDSDIGIRIDDGALEAIGTLEKPIKFMGNQKSKGYWEGMYFYGTDNTKNILSHVHLAYAKTALEIGGTTTSRVKLNDNNLSYNEAYGFIINNVAEIDNFSNMLVYENNIAGKITANNLYALDENSSFTGNTNDYIEMEAYALTEEQIWKDLTVPILVMSATDIDAFLTINAGASFLFDTGAGLRIDDGALTAIGTETKPIIFTGKQETAGYWGSIYFYGSLDTRNKMSYVELSYGGDIDEGLVRAGGTISSTLDISHAKISHSKGYGIETDCNAEVAHSDILYESNAQVDFYKPDNCVD